MGANTNCPIELPAFIKPAALPRASAGIRLATVPIKIEKLQAPVPTAQSNPIVKINPQVDSINGISVVPTIVKHKPPNSTERAPWRSAIMPASGCATPHTNWPTAMARLILTIPRPVDVFKGLMNSPMV